MRGIKLYISIAVLLALFGGAAYLAAGRGSGKTVRITVGGRVTEVTPVERMRVRTAEDAPLIGTDEYRLTVGGLVRRTLSLSLDDVKAIPSEQRLVPLPCVEGWTEVALWKGARLMDVLERAGVGDRAETVVFRSPGGYSTSLTLDDVRETDPILAYGVNGRRLPREQGSPVRLVVPERLGYKWIKWVTEIELIEGAYRGYWESRGYDNKADAEGR